jgi:uncharacterized protein YjbI with pentapeptide repeats
MADLVAVDLDRVNLEGAELKRDELAGSSLRNVHLG